MMNVKIETEYRAEARTGSGFYNTVIFDETKLSGRMTVGPYCSRPLARQDGARLVALMNKEKAA